LYNKKQIRLLSSTGVPGKEKETHLFDNASSGHAAYFFIITKFLSKEIFSFAGLSPSAVYLCKLI